MNGSLRHMIHYQEEAKHGRRAPCGAYQQVGPGSTRNMTSNTSHVTCEACRVSLRFKQALDKEDD